MYDRFKIIVTSTCSCENWRQMQTHRARETSIISSEIVPPLKRATSRVRCVIFSVYGSFSLESRLTKLKSAWLLIISLFFNLLFFGYGTCWAIQSLCITTVVYLCLDYARVLFYYWLNNQYRVHGNNGISRSLCVHCLCPLVARSNAIMCAGNEQNTHTKKESNKTEHSNRELQMNEKKQNEMSSLVERSDRAAHTVTFYYFVPRTSNQIHRKKRCFCSFGRSCFHIVLIALRRWARKRKRRRERRRRRRKNSSA